MEPTMQNHANQEILNSATIHFVQDLAGITSSFESYCKDRPIMLLKFWGNDFPYLNNTGNCAQECLPVPEDSEAQRLIRRLTGYPQFK
jgi:hypothetical protein